MQNHDRLLKAIVAGLFAVVFAAGASSVHATDTKLRPRAATSTWQVVDVQPNGNIVTIRSAAGVTKQLVVESSATLRKGMNLICTEDCGDQIGMGDTQIRILREMR